MTVTCRGRNKGVTFQEGYREKARLFKKFATREQFEMTVLQEERHLKILKIRSGSEKFAFVPQWLRMFLDGKKSKGFYFMTGKLYGIQISVLRKFC